MSSQRMPCEGRSRFTLGFLLIIAGLVKTRIREDENGYTA